MATVRNEPPQPGPGYIRVLAFLLGFAVLLLFVSRYYLIPAMEAYGQASPDQRQILVAHSRLLLAIILLILLVGLILTFRVGRFFFPRMQQPAKPTQYPDAYAEAARRIKVDDVE
ncbi:MAG TPA: hypothetical protein VIM11_00125 [Tepidisphaeraceae bacterium]|jgi:cytochrome b561